MSKFKFKVGDRVRVGNPSKPVYGEGVIVGDGKVRFDEFIYYMSETDYHCISERWELELINPPVDYNDGKWHGWNGGECPVHPETVVDVVTRNYGPQQKQAKYWGWWHSDHCNPIYAFRVVKEHKEPVPTRYNGECWAYHYTSTEPTTASCNAGGDSIHGTWTATHVDGELQSFTWTADE